MYFRIAFHPYVFSKNTKNNITIRAPNYCKPILSKSGGVTYFRLCCKSMSNQVNYFPFPKKKKKELLYLIIFIFFIFCFEKVLF